MPAEGAGRMSSDVPRGTGRLNTSKGSPGCRTGVDGRVSCSSMGVLEAAPHVRQVVWSRGRVQRWWWGVVGVGHLE
jgi:hypothetical protein